MASHVRKGDTVMVTAGVHKNTTGVIDRVLRSEDRVIIKGLNLRTKNVRPTQLNPQGGQVTKELPIHISNVSPVVDGKPVRVRFKTRDDGSKVRVAAKRGVEERELGVVRGPDAKKKGGA